MLWKNLSCANDIPKEGTRVLLGNYNKTSAQHCNNCEEYSIWSLFDVDIVQFNWEFPKDNSYIICSKNYKVVKFDEIIGTYNLFMIIDSPEISDRQEQRFCKQECSKLKNKD